mmetsp:Transcript_14134/g.24891  ORF Transcript_14134/g.24891 Transcript_14134/m.24891 type:complete len:468 (-) Transcript_14134:124-1527(-)
MATIVEMPRATTMHVIDPATLSGDKKPPDVCPKTGMPGSLKAYVVSRDPLMTVIPNFFSEAECDHLVNLVEGYWMPSMVGGSAYVKSKEENAPKSLENSVSQNRTSWSCMLRYAQTNVVERLEHRVASITGLPVTQVERFNMVRYAPGELFNEHHDGAFRPKTVFVYLNDLPEDEVGDTFFPVLGLSFKPRRGTAVMWSNVKSDGKEDSRMLHAGRAPLRSIKYGVNCFTNEKAMRRLMPIGPEIALADATPVKVSEIDDDPPPETGEEGTAQRPLRTFVILTDPKLVVIPRLLSAAEVEHFLEYTDGVTITPTGPFQAGTQTLRLLEAEGTEEIVKIENRMAAISGLPLSTLARLRLVRPGTEAGLSNRGCGRMSIYVCLSKEDEVFFPRLGLRVQLEAGDGIRLDNVQWTEEGFVHEDMRILRMHRGRGDVEGDSTPVIGLDTFFHDYPIREQQKARHFVRDDEV